MRRIEGGAAACMPELPEVETVRRTLEPVLVGRRVDAVKLVRSDIVDGSTAPRALLRGMTVRSLERRGKQLAILARDDRGERALVVQLGMSGQLFHRSWERDLLSTAHVHAVWRLENNLSLVFRDPRRFGGLRTFENTDALREHWSALGPDAYQSDAGTIARAITESCADSRRAIKSILLDQGVIAGVGNIYADEALFRAGIKPARAGHRMTSEARELLAHSIGETMKGAIEARGSTLRDYVDGAGRKGSAQLSHAVYGRGGERCVNCGARLRVGVIAQRTTVWCPNCQH